MLVDGQLQQMRPTAGPAGSLQQLLDRWSDVALRVQHDCRSLTERTAAHVQALDWHALDAPLPRAYQWLDASAYLRHAELVRRARGVAMPPLAFDDPIMYQGMSAPFLSWNDSIDVLDVGWGRLRSRAGGRHGPRSDGRVESGMRAGDLAARARQRHFAAGADTG
ncbi:hypothetical protein [Chitinasiproducens palmae]|uniref:hypothetical protein n=1 Tax=Chitinasiproducens palmae TaxID=1770053 RepID=UPI001F4019F1|nr:hypothetical protein [Chitinasiproducens palmae]